VSPLAILGGVLLLGGIVFLGIQQKADPRVIAFVIALSIFALLGGLGP
jgi:hypothetical protein